MSDTSRDRLMSMVIVLSAAALVVVFVVLVSSAEPQNMRLGIALLGVVVAAGVILLRPLWAHLALGFLLGAAPLATFPGLGTPIVLVAAAGVWFATLTQHHPEIRVSAMEVAVGLLMVVSLASLVMTVSGTRDVVEFLKWSLATSVVFTLLRLPRDQLRRFGRTFVYGAFTGAVISLGLLFFDRSGAVLSLFSVIGIRTIGDTGGLPRLTGTYVEPNTAGIFMMVALVLAVALLRGAQRIVIASVLLLALVCTLSRSAMLSVLMAVVFLLIFQPMPARVRATVGVMLAAGSAAVLSVPVINARFSGTFTDRGSLDRAASLADYTANMTGSWWFGRGWGLPEFIGQSAAYRSNHVANSPLLSVYRGGLVVGLAFVVVLVVGVVIAYRNVYTAPWEAGLIGAQFVGFTVVGLQLDFPVITHAPVTMVWSVLIAFLVANPVTVDQPASQRHTPHGTHRRTADA